jgi:hypothetical protein
VRLIFVLGIGAFCTGCFRVGPEHLNSDFGLDLDCSARIAPTDEVQLGQRLYSLGFDVLNRAQLAREMRVEFSSPVQIDAIDASGRMVSVVGTSVEADMRPKDTAPFWLSIALYSKPPTVRDSALERQLEQIARAIRTCSVTRIQRGANGADDSQKVYKQTEKMTRGWFLQAQQMAPNSSAYLLHAARR